MKYKNFSIDPVYIIGSDMREDKDGFVKCNPNETVKIFKKRSKKYVEYYQVTDLTDSLEYCREYTIKDCKKAIDDLLCMLESKGY